MTGTGCVRSEDRLYYVRPSSSGPRTYVWIRTSDREGPSGPPHKRSYSTIWTPGPSGIPTSTLRVSTLLVVSDGVKVKEEETCQESGSHVSCTFLLRWSPVSVAGTGTP